MFRDRRAPWVVVLSLLGCLTLPGGRYLAQEKQDDTAAEKDKKDKKKELPLEPARTIEFETSEGSWMSLDVAPDGRTILFELIGDLYTLPIAGGTHHIGHDVRQSAALLA